MSKASINITDEITNIRIDLGTYTRSIQKDSDIYLDTNIKDSEIIIYHGKHKTIIPFEQVKVPVLPTIEDLRLFINSLFATGGSGQATASNQGAQLAVLNNIDFNLTSPLQVDSTTSIIYIGYAQLGSLTTQPSWAIKRVDETTPEISITWSNGNHQLSNIWDDRATLTYQ